MLTLTDDQVEIALYAVRDLAVRRGLANRLPHGLAELHQKLETASLCGSETGGAAEELGDDLIDSDEAARLLGCSTRWVRQLRADLDGRKVAGRWVFHRSRIVEYAQARESRHGTD